MSANDTKLRLRLDARLTAFERQRAMPGIANPLAKQALIEQMVDSLHRTQFVQLVVQRGISPLRADPTSDLFDPVRAAILAARNGQHDEACWLVFLFTHFGKNRRTGYRLARDVYGALGGPPWTWARICHNPQALRNWLRPHLRQLKGGDGVQRHFGNHRKYESLDVDSDAGTAAVVESYVEWVGASHQFRFAEASQAAGGDRYRTFDELYRSMRSVKRFGRTGRFDYLTMIGKIGLARIEPPQAYLSGATGPLSGARLLFGGSVKSPLAPVDLEGRLDQLDQATRVGKQVLEDSLCNWQKSPLKYIAFRG
jgi:hypothetical protein